MNETNETMGNETQAQSKSTLQGGSDNIGMPWFDREYFVIEMPDGHLKGSYRRMGINAEAANPHLYNRKPVKLANRIGGKILKVIIMEVLEGDACSGQECACAAPVDISAVESTDANQ